MADSSKFTAAAKMLTSRLAVSPARPAMVDSEQRQAGRDDEQSLAQDRAYGQQGHAGHRPGDTGTGPVP